MTTGNAAPADSDVPASSSGGQPEEEIHLRYRIEEEVPRGTVVGNVIADAALHGRYSNAAMQQIRFRFLTETPRADRGAGGGPSAGAGGAAIAPFGLFEIGSTSGIIRTGGDLDRDSPNLCRQRPRCELSIDVVTQPVQYFRIIKVGIDYLQLQTV